MTLKQAGGLLASAVAAAAVRARVSGRSAGKDARAEAGGDGNGAVPVPRATAAQLSDRSIFDSVTVDSELRAGLDKSIQKELARLLNLLPDLQRRGAVELIGPVRFAIKAVLLEPANLALAKNIRSDVERRVRPGIPVLRGLLMFLAVVPIVSNVLFFVALPDTFLGFDTNTISLVIVFGALGSIVSILFRIRDFAQDATAAKEVSFWTGLSKPIVGMGFALFTYVAFNSNLIPVAISAGRENAFFAAVAFVAGFSERFAPDIAAVTEKTLDRRMQPPPPPPAPPAATAPPAGRS